MLLSSVAALVFALIALLWVLSGRVVIITTVVRRSESPLAFWVCVAACAALSLYAAVLSLIRPPGIL